MSSPRHRHDRLDHGEPCTFWEYNQRGVCFFNRGRYDLAIREFQRAVGASVFPLAVLYVNLGAAYLRCRMYGPARHSLEEGLRVDPEDQVGHVLLGQALLAAGETGEARTEFDCAWQLNPDSPEGGTAEQELRRLYGVLLK